MEKNKIDILKEVLSYHTQDFKTQCFKILEEDGFLSLASFLKKNDWSQKTYQFLFKKMGVDHFKSDHYLNILLDMLEDVFSKFNNDAPNKVSMGIMLKKSTLENILKHAKNKNFLALKNIFFKEQDKLDSWLYLTNREENPNYQVADVMWQIGGLICLLFYSNRNKIFQNRYISDLVIQNFFTISLVRYENLMGKNSLSVFFTEEIIEGL